MVQKTQFVKDLKDKDSVNSPFLIKFSAVATAKNSKPYLNLIFMDNSGEIEARAWDDVNRLIGQAVRDNFVFVEGRCQIYQGRKQVIISRLQVLREDEVDQKQYIPEGSTDTEAMYSRLMGFVDSMQDPFYRALAESVLKDDAEIVDMFKRAPAAKSIHHAYRSGLLEHVTSITALLDFISHHYGKCLDRDLLFLGSFFHDIGKLWELSYARVTDYTTEGRLVGHLVMGVELIDKKIRALEAMPGRLPGPFPEEKKLLVKHLVLSHHGQLEFGSPKRPKCLEALVLHYIDDLDSKINSIRTFIEQDKTPGRWTALHRSYERYFFKPEVLPTNMDSPWGAGT